MLRSELSVVVPTRNRPDHLRRLLAFYAARNFSHRILVLDSSDNKSENTSLVSRNRQRLDLELFPFDKDTLLVDKNCDGLKEVKTPYVVFCADDDFIIPSGIDQCVTFLQRNPTYIAAQGECVHYYVSPSSLAVNNTAQICERRREPLDDLDYDDALHRLVSHVLDYRPTFYAVHRTRPFTDLFIRSWQVAPNILHQEILPSFKTVIAGKVKRLAIPYEFREEHPGRLFSKIGTWSELLTSGDWDRHCRNLYDGIHESLIEAGVENAHDVASATCQEWLKMYHDKYYIRPTLVENARREMRRGSAAKDAIKSRTRPTLMALLQHARKRIRRMRSRVAKPNHRQIRLDNRCYLADNSVPQEVVAAIHHEFEAIYRAHPNAVTETPRECSITQ